jgi:hypothetical protein
VVAERGWQAGREAMTLKPPAPGNDGDGVSWTDRILAAVPKVDVSVNAADYDYVGDGVADDTGPIVGALEALTAYTGGHGGGRIVLPRTATGIAKVTPGEILLTDGQYIVGDGARGVLIRGSGAGALIGSESDAGSDPLNNYVGLENLYVYNQSSSASALAADFHQVGHLRFKGVTFQGAAAGGYVVRLRACIIVDFLDRCHIGGAGVSACEAGLLLNGSNNVVHLHGISITDAKSGVLALGGTNLVIDGGSHFENLAGGATNNAAIALDGVQGGAIKDNYFESNPMSAIAAFSGVGDPTRGFEVGFNYMTNQGSPFIDASNFAESDFFPNVMIPGANATNANGLIAQSSNARRCRYYPQRLASGSGTPVDTVGATDAQRFDTGGRLQTLNAAGSDAWLVSNLSGDTWQRVSWTADGVLARGLGAAQPDVKFVVGAGTPEGAVTAAPGSLYQRTNGGANTSLYVKESGTGNTGWVAK